MSQWVRHISGQGEKWEVVDEHPSWMTPDASPNPDIEWLVRGSLSQSRIGQHLLPKSEYILCDPPEQWVDVTAECSLVSTEDNIRHNYMLIQKSSGYRLRKVQVFTGDGAPRSMWAFIVEKQVQP